MDPTVVQRILTAVAVTPLMLEEGVVLLQEANDEQLQEIKKSLKKNGAIAGAKRALKIYELCGEIAALPDFKNASHATDLVERTKQRGRIAVQHESGAPRRAAPPLAESTLAIVPFFETIKAPPNDGTLAQRTFRIGKGRDIEGMGQLVPQIWVTHLKFGARFLKLLIVVGPILLGYVLLAYLILTVGYLLSSPRLFVKGFFWILDATPTYMGFFAEQAFDEVKVQISQRMR
jgi:hypothetical protein